MPLPEVELYTNLQRLPHQPCEGNHPSSPRQVRACFSPAFCFMHGDNNHPRAGWTYITAGEARILTIARLNLWTEDCLEELIAREIEAHMERVAITDDEEEAMEETAAEEIQGTGCSGRRRWLVKLIKVPCPLQICPPWGR
jgi:hypothetical protein